jgi:hypothetical protein
MGHNSSEMSSELRGSPMAHTAEEDKLSVSAAIESLRDQLEQAWTDGQGHPVQFGVDEVTLTLTVEAVGKKAGGGKVRWYVVEAGGDVSRENSTTQTLELKLKPVLVNPATRQEWPLRVKGSQPQPGP